jgi:predicted metal-dependent hydrolase
MALLTAHADWVAQRLAALPVRLEFADGVLVPVDGRPRLIRHVADARGGAWLDGDEILVAGTVEFLPRRVADFFRLEARRRFSALAAEKAAQAGAKPRRVTVKDTRSRWGSCTADRTLSFSWRLLMAPGFVQDYVAAHEVAHLRHMNHGPHFWALVEELTPHTRTAMTWLHAEGAGLLCVG